MRGRVLVVAGSDSGGGAGIQADIKAITALGAFAMTALTALTAQNTLGVHGVHPVPPDFIRQQIAVVLEDIGADVIKTGMLGDTATIETVCEALAHYAPGVPLVLDPVMVAKGGHHLLATEAVATMRRRLLPMATVLTPNLPEAEALAGMTIASVADMRAAAGALLALGVPAVLLKGGHLAGDTLVDLLATADGIEEFSAPRIQTVHKETNPRFHALISAFKERTGCPVIVNTSFNVRGEPIVCLPEDAFRCFMGTEIEVLAVGNCYFRKEDQDPSLKQDYKGGFELD